jgi:hypothetical protein
MVVENFNSTQDYLKIKITYSNDERFIDKQFPACNSSIGSEDFIDKYNLRPMSSNKVQWRRAKVILLAS